MIWRRASGSYGDANLRSADLGMDRLAGGDVDGTVDIAFEQRDEAVGGIVDVEEVADLPAMGAGGALAGQQ